MPSPPPQTNLFQEKQSLRIRLGCSLVTEPSMCKALSSVFSIEEKQQQILYTNSTQSVLSHVGLTQIYRKVFGVQSFRMAHVWPRITCLRQRKQRLGTMTRPSQCYIRAVPLFAISGTEGRGEQPPPNPSLGKRMFCTKLHRDIYRSSILNSVRGGRNRKANAGEEVAAVC